MLIEMRQGWGFAQMVRRIPVVGARVVLRHRRVTAKLVVALGVNARPGPWRQEGARPEVTSDQLWACWCVGFVVVALELQDGETYGW